MMEFVQTLTELIRESSKIYAIIRSTAENSKEIHFLNESIEWENMLAKAEDLVNLLQICVQRAMKPSIYKEEYDFLALLISDHTPHTWTALLDPSSREWK
jgi:hypothetical protein